MNCFVTWKNVECNSFLHNALSPPREWAVRANEPDTDSHVTYLVRGAKEQMEKSLNKVVHAYNCTRHEATGYSSFYLLYGRYPWLPAGILFGLGTNVSSSQNYQQYVQKWRSDMKLAYQLATRHLRASRARGIKYHEPNVPASVLQAGDRVLVRNLSGEDLGNYDPTGSNKFTKLSVKLEMVLT